MSSSSSEENNNPSEQLKSIQKDVSDLSYEYDDFYEIWNPLEDASEEQKTLRNMVKYAISLKSDIDSARRDSETVEETLDEIFKMQSQGSECLANDMCSLEELEKNIAIVNDAISCLCDVVQEDKQINLRQIQEDFVEQRKIMKNTIIATFKEKADDVIKILNDLFQRHFSADRKYLDISGGKYNKHAVEKLITLGIIEVDDEQQNIKFLDLNG